jgi:hypothetical protein
MGYDLELCRLIASSLTPEEARQWKVACLICYGILLGALVAGLAY